MGRLSGKLALITGGNSGIGLATARAFVAEGARLAITGRNEATLKAARESLPAAVTCIKSDAGDLGAIARLFETLQADFGALDILFVNAGIGKASPLGQTSEAAFDEIFDINVKGLFFTVQSAIPLLRAGSSVILNASTAARTGAPGASAYSGSKAAVRAFARNFAAELAPRGIRVNVVSPGPIATPIWERTGAPAALLEANQRRIEKGVPIGRMGTAEEVARAVVFLASDDSAFMLGSEIVVDGGLSELPAGAPAYR